MFVTSRFFKLGAVRPLLTNGIDFLLVFGEFNSDLLKNKTTILKPSCINYRIFVNFLRMCE